eukprot:3954729-Lingulodinium_polyedra.AAC.1
MSPPISQPGLPRILQPPPPASQHAACIAPQAALRRGVRRGSSGTPPPQCWQHPRGGPGKLCGPTSRPPPRP